MSNPATMTLTRLNFDRNEFLDFQYIRALSYEAYAGASVGELAAVSRLARTFGSGRDAFVQAWARQGDHVAALASTALEQGRRASARTYFLRAYNYYRIAEFYYDRRRPDDHRRMYEQSVACFDKAVPLFSSPVEAIAIPYIANVRMPGYLFKAAADDRPRPTVIISGGGDGHGEELYFLAGVPEALERGFNVILFHGPGQRGLLHRHPTLTFRSDAEVPIGCVIDYALSRPDVDPERLALYGLSFGGYLAPRAAAYDRRIKALIANAPIMDFRQLIVRGAAENIPRPLQGVMSRLVDRLTADQWNLLARYLCASSWIWQATIENQMLWTSGTTSFGQFLEWARAYSLTGIEPRIACPTLCLTAEGEGPVARQQAQAFYDGLMGERCILPLRVEDGADSHCGVSNVTHTAILAFDWLRQVLQR